MVQLSVVVPNYNHAGFLPECLDSILAQSFPSMEILVIDDASTDASVEVIARYQMRHPSVRLIENKQNRGVIARVNQSLELIAGEYVIFCAADDLLLPRFFSRAMACLNQHPELGLCSGDSCRFFDRRPYQMQPVRLGMWNEPRIIHPQEIQKVLWQKSLWIPSHSTIYRSELIRKYGAYDQQLKHLCDWFLNYQIALRHPIGYIPELFSAVRVIEQSYGMKIRRDKRERETAFERLLQLIRQSELEPIFQKSGVLGHVGIAMVIYLAQRPRFWKFVPRALKKKIQFWMNGQLSAISAHSQGSP